MVLLNVFDRLKISNRIVVAHFHHGESFDEAAITEMIDFRNNSQKLVQKVVQDVSKRMSNWSFSSRISSQKLVSEAQMRAARTEFIDEIRDQLSQATKLESVVVTGHHQDDLLETRILKLLRGSGSDSISNFKKWNGRVYRPFLPFSKSELRDYAVEHNLLWVEDPSNGSGQYLRNWIRNTWLQSLDQRADGLRLSLARGIENLLAVENKDVNVEKIIHMLVRMDVRNESSVFTINRLKYRHASQKIRQKLIYTVIKRAQLARYDAQSKMKLNPSDAEGDGSRKKSPQFWDMTSGRIKEICKQLDKNQKDLRFNIGPMKALTSEETIVLEFYY